MGSPGRAFDFISDYLSEQGFEVVHDSGTEGFGSRYVDYRRGSTRLRVIWDGGDEWLVAQELDSATGHGRDIAIQRVGRRTADDSDLLGFQQGLANWLHPTGSPGR